jgi:hypothetical protein
VSHDPRSPLHEPIEEAMICGTKVQWPQRLFFGIVKFTISTNRGVEADMFMLNATLKF